MFKFLKKKVKDAVDKISKKAEEEVEEEIIEEEVEIKDEESKESKEKKIKKKKDEKKKPKKEVKEEFKEEISEEEKGLPITRDEALEFLKSMPQEQSDMNHYLETEAIMKSLAKHFGEDEEYWGMIGLLHDIDWSLTKDDWEYHTVKAEEILKEKGFDDEFIQIVQSHGYGIDEISNFKDKKRVKKIEYALVAAETITGIIYAYALMRNKKISDMEVKGFKKKFKDKSFAQNCNRELVKEIEETGLELNEFFKISIDAVKEIAKDIGLDVEEEVEEKIVEEVKEEKKEEAPKEKKPVEKKEEEVKPKKKGFFKRFKKEKEEEEFPEEVELKDEQAPEEAKPEEVKEAPKEEKPEEEKKKGFFKKIKEKVVTKTISEKKFEELFWELEVVLLENNVAVEVIEKIKEDMKLDLVNVPIKKGGIQDLIIKSLRESIEELFVGDFDLIKKVKEKKPYVIVFLGINGSGKTTTISKIAHLLKEKGLSIVLAAGDTFRAASIEQLQEHADKLGVKLIKHDYGSDAAAVGFDAVKHAVAKKIDVVLVDTAGRMQSNKDLMREIEKIIRVVKPDLKVFVGESITGNDCCDQAREFNNLVGIDGMVLSKADIDEKGGAAISVSYVTRKPILYLGTGQGLNDLKKFNKKELIESLGL